LLKINRSIDLMFFYLFSLKYSKFIYQKYEKELFYGSVIRFLDNAEEWLSYIAGQIRRKRTEEEVFKT